MTRAADVAVVGLAVMGSNLARNIRSRGYEVAVYNRTTSVTEQFMKDFGSEGFQAASSLQDLVARLERPRKIILMIQAGPSVDKVLEALYPLLDSGDIIIDGGNSYYRDTMRREDECRDRELSFLGVGISGGEEGALLGPSIMPGGPKEAWEHVAPMLEKIAARADGACTAYMGPDGAGHFVKMVHNGIEYADMQLIAESYDVLRKLFAVAPPELAALYAQWNRGALSSFLLEITAKIFERKDPETDGYLIDLVRDSAQQKGTGRWTAQEALDYDVAIPTISTAVEARIISSSTSRRALLQKRFETPASEIESATQSIEKGNFVAQLEWALYAAKIICYAQGFDLIRTASDRNTWDVDLAEVARIWKGGCIIRARFLDEIVRAYRHDPRLLHLLADEKLAREVEDRISALRTVVGLATRCGVAVPGFSSALAYIDAFRSVQLPQNLIQAQRDCFGAHTFERIDREGSFHVEWI